jgi:hypothetical protein
VATSFADAAFSPDVIASANAGTIAIGNGALQRCIFCIAPPQVITLL